MGKRRPGAALRAESDATYRLGVAARDAKQHAGGAAAAPVAAPPPHAGRWAEHLDSALVLEVGLGPVGRAGQDGEAGQGAR
ncbi:hypothetical protein [Haliangium sp. UPWRP_2]|uniref:hypothetical protein n=1 Tax=Haliangium sp. UPWRP_2 TaxID=1931276 RepID=UPI000D0CCB4A|nr:hypothetical protein [Haliangium sp. UPWRP_2]PSM30806.1 hypothetical protein BVG81_008625 [Haliangium sp. UPWRP_2]